MMSDGTTGDLQLTGATTSSALTAQAAGGAAESAEACGNDTNQCKKRCCFIWWKVLCLRAAVDDPDLNSCKRERPSGTGACCGCGTDASLAVSPHPSMLLSPKLARVPPFQSIPGQPLAWAPVQRSEVAFAEIARDRVRQPTYFTDDFYVIFGTL